MGSSGTGNRWPRLMPSRADYCDDDDEARPSSAEDLADNDDGDSLVDLIIMLLLI